MNAHDRPLGISKLKKVIPMPIKRRLKRAWDEFQTTMVEINSNPTFVLGNQRSGTSAIAVLLAEMTGLSVSKDLTREYRANNPTYARVRRGELPFSEFINNNKLDFSRDIIKEPHLTVFYQELTQHFPQSRFAFVLRDPRDNIRSILNRLRIPGHLPCLNRVHQVEINPAWELVINGRWLGLKGENYIEMLAERWNLMVDIYLENASQMIPVRYEHFLKDKPGEIARLARSLDLAQLNDVSDKVDIQFQVPGDKNVRWLDFFGHANLARIEDISSERMKLLDYPTHQKTKNHRSTRQRRWTQRKRKPISPVVPDQ